MQPEMVRIAYLELSAEALAASTEVTEEQLRSYYDSHQDEFARPESRRARHILVRADAGVSPEAEQDARKKADDVLKRLKGGEAFENVAKQVSEDPGSAKEGGDLGFFDRGVMDKAFEDAAFSLKKGELSDPVRSAFGYHIIRVDEVRGGGVKPFDEARGEIRRKIGEEGFYDVAEKLNELTYQNPDTLDNAADALKLPIQHSDYFALSGGRGVAANPKVVQAAFSEDVAKGNNSETIEVAPNHVIVLRVDDRRPEQQRPVDEVRGQIVEELRREKARAQSRAAADQALEALKTGADPATVAKENGGEWKRVDAVTRTDAQLPRPVVETAFRMPRTAESTPAFDRTSLPTGDEAVVVLTAVKDGAGASPGDKPADKGAALLRADAEASYQGVLATLKKNADIKINKDQM